MSKTIRRDKLRALAASGQLVLVNSYHFDDMGGESRCQSPMPVRVSSGYGDFIEGQCNLRDDDFTSRCGAAYQNEDGTIHLRVHSNCSYDFRLKAGTVAPLANKGTNKAKRPENQRMQVFLALHGIQATPKWIADGSLKRSWRLYNHDMPWSIDLANQLNALGFRSLRNEPLGQFDGNGGLFSVFVRGHEELLSDPVSTPAPVPAFNATIFQRDTQSIG